MKKTGPIDYKAEEKQLLEKTSEPANFVKELIRLHSSDFNSKTFDGWLACFCNEQNLNLVELCLMAIRAGEDVFRVTYLLQHCLPDLTNPHASVLVALFAEFAERAKRDLAGGILHDPIERLAKNNPSFGAILADEILRSGNEAIFVYVIAIYVGMGAVDCSYVKDRLKALLSSTETQRRSIGLRTVGCLASIPDEALEEICDFVRAAARSAVEQLAANAGFSLCRLAERKAELRPEVVELSKSKFPMVQRELSYFLSKKQGNLEEWTESCFLHTAEYELSSKEAIDGIDHCLQFLCLQNRWPLVQEFFKRWVVSHKPRDHRDNHIDQVFGSTVQEIAKAPALTATLLVDWFNQDDVRFHFCASKLLDYLHLHKTAAPVFQQEHLKTLEDRDLVFITRKILGNVIEFEYAASMIFSLLNQSNQAPRIESPVVAAFVENLGYNFPRKSIEFLQTKKESGVPSQARVAQEALSKIESAFDRFRQLEKSPELYPLMDIEMKLDRLLHGSISRSMREANKRSIMSMFSQVSVKEGRGTFSFHSGKFSNPSYMSEYSTSMELPRGDVLDEVGKALERHWLKSVKRDAK